MTPKVTKKNIYDLSLNLRLGKGQSASVLLTRFFYLVIDDKVFLFKVINDSYKQVHFLKEQILGL